MGTHAKREPTTYNYDELINLFKSGATVSFDEIKNMFRKQGCKQVQSNGVLTKLAALDLPIYMVDKSHFKLLTPEICQEAIDKKNVFNALKDVING